MAGISGVIITLALVLMVRLIFLSWPSSYLSSRSDLSRSFLIFLVYIINWTFEVKNLNVCIEIFRNIISSNFVIFFYTQTFVFWSVLVHTSFVYHFLCWPAFSWLWVSTLCKLSLLNARAYTLNKRSVAFVINCVWISVNFIYQFHQCDFRHDISVNL